MAKTLRDIQSIKNVDVIIEVVDARAIQTSINKELTKTFNKPKLVVALKSDLSDISDIETTDNLLLGSIKNRKFKNQVIQALDNIFLTKKQQLKSKGLIHPQFYGLVIGLPNVGKSSLINFLGTKTKMVTANLPGVTKNRQLVKINDEYFLYDTAGVLHKRIHNDIDGYKLALIGAIKKEILPLSDVVQ
jgi:ribosome biogenesis GTPase A